MLRDAHLNNLMVNDVLESLAIYGRRALLVAVGDKFVVLYPVGWAPGHGPGSGRLCCKQLICYDAIPGHRMWGYFSHDGYNA